MKNSNIISTKHTSIKKESPREFIFIDNHTIELFIDFFFPIYTINEQKKKTL